MAQFFAFRRTSNRACLKKKLPCSAFARALNLLRHIRNLHHPYFHIQAAHLADDGFNCLIWFLILRRRLLWQPAQPSRALRLSPSSHSKSRELFRDQLRLTCGGLGSIVCEPIAFAI